MFGGNIAPDAKLRLTSEIKDIVRLEQYFDFMTNRAFRMTLMVPKGAPINRNITADRLGSLWISAVGLASGITMTAKALSTNKSLHYQVNDNGPCLDTASPVTKAALVVLGKAFPANLHFEELLKLAREYLSTDHNSKVSLNEDRATLGADLFVAYTVNLLKLSATRNQALPISDLKGGTKNILVAEHIRYQARTSNFVTNLNHERISLDEGVRQILLLLDGTKDELSLKQAFCEFMRSQELVIQTQKGKKIIPKVDSPEVSGLLTAALEGFAKASLLTRN